MLKGLRCRFKRETLSQTVGNEEFIGGVTDVVDTETDRQHMARTVKTGIRAHVVEGGLSIYRCLSTG